jgi:hypothetical protein
MKNGGTWTRLVLACAIALSLVSSIAQAGGNKVVIKNKTDWEIHHLFLSPVEVEKWGPDQLGDEIIAPGKTFELHSIPCDEYDVKLIDEDGDECVVTEVTICSGQEGWIIDNDDLLACEEESGE